MEIRHLRYFVLVAEEASFSRAAERLAMAISPLSRRIRDLEAELGVPLFERGYHRITLTDAGRALLPEAATLVRRFDALPGLLPDLSPPPSVLTVGSAPEVSAELRSTFTGMLRHGLPDLTVRQRPSSTASLLRLVAGGAVDVAFVHGRVAERELASVPVQRQPVRVVVAKGLGFDRRDCLELRELSGLPYIFLKAAWAPYVAHAAETLLVESGVRERIEVHTHGDLVPPVSAGTAFTVCGARYGTTRSVFLREPVLMLPFGGDRVRLLTTAVWRADREHALHGVPDLVRELGCAMSRTAADGRPERADK